LTLPKHTPYLNGKGGVRIGLKPINEENWLEIDDKFKNEINLKKSLLSSKKKEVLQSSSDSQAAQEELLELITNHLEEYHSDKYDFDGKIIHVKATKESIDLLSKELVPIETASLLVQEDLILMNPRGDKFYLEAASLSAPSHWSLTDKFSKNLMNIHEGVPSYKEKIGNRVNQIFNKLPTDKILERLNWSLFDSPNLFQPVRNTTHVKIKKKIVEELYLRVERQTIRKLPVHGSIVFTIRVHVDPLLSISKNHDLLNGLDLAIKNLPQEMKDYKSINKIEEEVLTWIQDLKN